LIYHNKIIDSDSNQHLSRFCTVFHLIFIIFIKWYFIIWYFNSWAGRLWWSSTHTWLHIRIPFCATPDGANGTGYVGAV